MQYLSYFWSNTNRSHIFLDETIVGTYTRLHLPVYLRDLWKGVKCFAYSIISYHNFACLSMKAYRNMICLVYGLTEHLLEFDPPLQTSCLYVTRNSTVNAFFVNLERKIGTYMLVRINQTFSWFFSGCAMILSSWHIFTIFFNVPKCVSVC